MAYHLDIRRYTRSCSSGVCAWLGGVLKGREASVHVGEGDLLARLEGWEAEVGAARASEGIAKVALKTQISFCGEKQTRCDEAYVAASRGLLGRLLLDLLARFSLDFLCKAARTILARLPLPTSTGAAVEYCKGNMR